jgi:regulator of sigma E protease
MTILATIIVLGVLIFVHEFGHFAAAKAVGVEVQRFSIGFGPKLLGFRWGETEYALSAIPLGGYVKMGGMADEVMEKIEGGAVAGAREPSPRDFDAKPIWARTLVISAGVIMNMIFAFALFTFTFAHWGAPQIATTRLGRVQAATLPAGAEALGTLQPGTHFVRVGDRVVKDWGDVQDAFLDAPAGRLSVETADPAQRVEIELPADAEARQRLVLSLNWWVDATVGAVSPGSPAEKAGLEVGDRIVAVGGTAVHTWYDFRALVKSRPGERVELTLERDGREIIRPVTLDSAKEERPDGTSAEVGQVGINGPADSLTYKAIPLREAVVAGYQQTAGVTGMLFGFLHDLVTGGVSPRSMGSIVTIGEASGSAARAGLDAFLGFMAMFSVNLAVLNLLPIPVLDGGHLLFLGIEAVRGRALSVEQRLRWSNVGFLIVMGIMLWALSNDFLRLFGL